MLSSVVKNIFPKKIGVEKKRIYHVAFMPYTAKKDEIKRPQFIDETDLVITSRELAQMIKDAKIDFKNLPDSQGDTIYSEYSGSGAIFCASGGVMEAALRSAYKFITGKDMVPLELKSVRGIKEGIKTASININGKKINVAVAPGIKNAMDLLEKILNKQPGFEEIHFLEVMRLFGIIYAVDEFFVDLFHFAPLSDNNVFLVFNFRILLVEKLIFLNKLFVDLSFYFPHSCLSWRLCYGRRFTQSKRSKRARTTS